MMRMIQQLISYSTIMEDNQVLEVEESLFHQQKASKVMEEDYLEISIQLNQLLSIW